MIVEGVVIALGISLVSFVVSRVRGARAGRLERQTMGQQQRLLPEGEFAVWPLRRLMATRQPSRVRVEGGQVSWFAPGSTQPEWQSPADRVGVRILAPTRWVDVTRVRLQPPTGEPVTLRVSRELQRPVGPLDQRYERRLGGYLASFVETLGRNGATIG
ncbi:hypothetical protein [Knoellia locipacati]|nr:hypothetical protein [Knoellia locipacati]